MPSIADATGSRRPRERRRLVTGVGLLLVGAALVGFGAAGVVQAASLRTGAAAGGLAIWASMLALAVRTPLGEHERTIVAAGASFGLAGLLGFWAISPADGLAAFGPSAVVAGVAYLLGLTVVLATVLAAVTIAPTRRPSSSEPSSSAAALDWKRSPDGGLPGQAADGGSTDDDLSFPLEDD